MLQSTSRRPKVGPYSRTLDRAAVGASIDGRSREGRFLRSYERMLAEHLGGRASKVQREMIRLAARLALRVELMDERALAPGAAPMGGDRTYLAWHARLVRTLAQLGLAAAPAPAETLDQHLARLALERAPTNDTGRPVEAAQAVPTASGGGI